MDHAYATLRQCTQLHVIDGEQAEPASFRRHYLSENRPCLFGSTAVGVECWRATKEWATHRTSHAQEDSSHYLSHHSITSSSSVADFHSQLLAAKRLVRQSLFSQGNDAKYSYPSPTSTPNFPNLLQLCNEMHESVLIAEINLPRSSLPKSTASNTKTSSSSQQQIHAYGSNTSQGSMRSFLLQWQSNMNARSCADFSPPSVHYLKDWHLCLTHPKYEAYDTPMPLRDDWMNWFHLNSSSLAKERSPQIPPHFPSRVSLSDDFRFCYMGERATFTPLHADVYNSYSWSTNVVGRKLWVMFHPAWRPFLTEDGGSLINDALAIQEVDIWLTQQRLEKIAQKFAATTQQMSSSSVSASTSASSAALPPCYVWIQLEGETLFVPSGWLHQVHNLDDCISINHNWMNASNLANMYSFLQYQWCEAIEAVQGFDFNAGVQSVNAVESAIESGQLDPLTVQDASRVMHSSVGMSWDEFYAFLQFHRSRIESSSDVELTECAMNADSAASSIVIIDQVLEQMKRDGMIKLIDIIHECDHPVKPSSHDPVSSRFEQLSLGKASILESSSDSEDEFPVRRRRIASNIEGQARRRRVIREDDDEDEAFDDCVPDESQDMATVAEPREEQTILLSEEQPGLTSVPAVPYYSSTVSHVDPCSVPVSSLLDVVPAAVVSASDHDTENLDPFEPRRVLSFTLALYFQHANVYFQLPALPQNVLELVSEYAVPPMKAFSASTSDVALCSSSSSAILSSSATTGSRGPFFVVQTHYANGDTFSEEYCTVEELLGGIRMFVQDCWKRIQLVKQESDDSLPEVQEALKQLCTALDAFQLKQSERSSSSSSMSSLNELFELTLALGDAMVEFQVGYGWTFIHECGRHNSE